MSGCNPSHAKAQQLVGGGWAVLLRKETITCSNAYEAKSIARAINCLWDNGYATAQAEMRYVLNVPMRELDQA